MIKQKDRTLKDELPRLLGAQYATGDQWRNNPRKNEGMEPKHKQYTADVCSSPVRTPTLQLAAEQPLTGEYRIPPKKIPHIKGQRRNPSKMVGGAKSHLE